MGLVGWVVLVVVCDCRGRKRLDGRCSDLTKKIAEKGIFQVGLSKSIRMLSDIGAGSGREEKQCLGKIKGLALVASGSATIGF